MNQPQRMTEMNPIEQALSDFNDLQRQCEALQDAVRQLKDMNVGLMQENNLMRERSTRAEQERDSIKAEVFELDTRLDVIVETIMSARASAQRRARLAPEVPESTTESRVETAMENVVVELLPRNDLAAAQ